MHVEVLDGAKSVTYKCCLVTPLLQKCYSDFELQGVPSSALDNKTYKDIRSRLQVLYPAPGMSDSLNI